jgi:imidazolonepropionase-like amidohydrolase
MATDIVRKGPALEMPWADELGRELDGIFARIARAIHHGARIVLGSDCGGAEARLHGCNADEILHYVECGLTHRDALLSATAVAAEALNLSDAVGAIAPGLAADLIAVDCDPLQDPKALTTTISLVMQAGTVIRDDHGTFGTLSATSDAQTLPMATVQT